MSLKADLHKKIDGPAVAVDTVVFAIDEELLKVLLIKIGKGPYGGKWAVPGGLIQIGESPEKAAIRVLDQKTNIKTGHLEQLYTFGDPKRDVRGQIISVAYILMINDIKKYETKPTDVYTDIQWFPVGRLPEMAFDHKKIVEFAYKRLVSKMSYSSIAYSLLPPEFTLTEIQRVYEIVWRKKIDKRNFRKKIMGYKIIVPSKKTKTGPFRPAKMYRFSKTGLVYFD